MSYSSSVFEDVLFWLLNVLMGMSLGCAIGVVVARPKTRQPVVLTVTATGSVQMEPEVAWVRFAISTEAEQAGDAVARNTQIASQVLKALQELGVDEKDVQTTAYRLLPREERDREGRLLRRYFVVEEEFRVTVRDLNKVGQVLDAVLRAGVNRVYDVTFGIEDLQAAQRQARTLAVKQAEAQAQAIAEAAGMRVRRIRQMQFGAAPRPGPVVKAAPMAAEAAAVPIAPGTLQVSATVTVEFELER